MTLISILASVGGPIRELDASQVVGVKMDRPHGDLLAHRIIARICKE